MLNEIAPRTRPYWDGPDQVPGGSDIQTPFADEVLRLRRTRPLSEPIVSFHALPWGQRRSLAGAGPIGEKYRQLFGEAFLDTDVTYSAGVLDSYFRPSASLDLAQHLAAEAFRAGSTFFITCGTSIANQVAFDALAGASKRILVDRTARQSVHIAAGQFSASVDYGPAAEGLSPAGQPLLDIVQLLEMVAAAADPGTPDDTIVLAACSYDGVLYNLHRIMSECLALSPTTAFLVDEAWSAISTSRRPLASDVEARSAWRQHCIGLPRASTRAPASSSTPPRPASVTTRQNDVVYEEIAHVQAKQVPSDCHRSARRRHCPDRSTAFAAAPAHAAARPIR